jgi:hypothetical protein
MVGLIALLVGLFVRDVYLRLQGLAAMDEKLLAALIGLVGLLIGLFVRDVVLQLHLINLKRQQEEHDKQRAYQDAVWNYAAPLLRAVESLMYRLQEIVDQGPAIYFLPESPKSIYSDYKRISTLYRLAAILGWVRAYRKERSYLDPTKDTSSSEIEKLIGDLERALADGQEVELIHEPGDAVSFGGLALRSSFEDASDLVPHRLEVAEAGAQGRFQVG